MVEAPPVIKDDVRVQVVEEYGPVQAENPIVSQAKEIFKPKKVEVRKEPAKKSGPKKPYWQFQTETGNLVFAKVGTHYDESFLAGLGMRPTKKDPKNYVAKYDMDLLGALDEKYLEKEGSDDIPV